MELTSAANEPWLLFLTQELVKYHRANSTVLAKGLYLGYLKLQSSVELIHIMVPQLTPNVLPGVKIRDCPNVTRCVSAVRVTTDIGTFLIYACVWWSVM